MTDGRPTQPSASLNQQGLVANAVAMWRGKSGTESLPGISVNDLSSAEQTAVAEAKKRKSANGEMVGTGSGSGASSSDGVVGITKRDIMSLLAEQQEVATHANKILLSEALAQTTSRNSQLLAVERGSRNSWDKSIGEFQMLKMTLLNSNLRSRKCALLSPESKINKHVKLKPCCWPTAREDLQKLT